MSAQDPFEPAAPDPGSVPARGFGSPRHGAVPRMENVRVTAPDLARRAALEKTRSRLVITTAGFGLLFLAVIGKLADATILQPVHPREASVPEQVVRDPGPVAAMDPADAPHRASITDRNGRVLATSMPTAEVTADPRQMIDTAQAAHQLKSVLPEVNEAELGRRLASSKSFIYVARRITPRQEQAVNQLGIPGVEFKPSERRSYPLGNVAAQVLGAVDVDGHGVAGVEKFFDQRLARNPAPLRLSIDLRVQAMVRQELASAMTEFTAIGAAGIVMDVDTGELLAMVSLPDYDANAFGQAAPDDRFNRAVTGLYEPGSTFKLQTAAMALDSGAANIWNQFDAAHDIHVGRFTISDYKGQHRFLYLPEVLAYSSNLGAAHIALAVGAARQRAWLDRMGMFQPVGVELPEAARPIVPSVQRWSQITTMTVGFGHGIAVSPLHVVRGTAALANGGVVLRPTLLARPEPDGRLPGGATQVSTHPGDAAGVGAGKAGSGASESAGSESGGSESGGADEAVADPTMPAEPVLKPPVALNEAMMQPATGAIVRKLMRLVVTNGYGKPAEVPGYYVGGKTGTAEKVGAHGAYQKHTNVSAFICVFPMNKPRYAVYMMLDEPHGDKRTGFYSTAGVVSAPAAGRVIARIAPMLGLYPDTADAQVIDASLYIPMQPNHPAGARTVMETNTQTAPAGQDEAPAAERATPVAPPAGPRTHRHEATLLPAHAAAGMRRTAFEAAQGGGASGDGALR